MPLIPVPRGSSLPASFAQRALWFHDQLEPGSCAYNLVSAYRLSGGLDVKALEQSVNQIIDRHEVLRTVFEAVDGQPVQTILPEMRIELPVINLSSAASDSVRESEVRRIAGALAGQPFNLARGPLLRTALLRLAKDEHVLLVAIHHIVFDAWSIGIFARELSLLYNSSRTGEPSSLPQLTIQYGDFAVWQTGLLQGVNLETLLSYWKNQLERLPTLMLPSGRSQPLLDARSSAREDFVLAKELSADLRELSDRAGTTLFMVLLAAYKIALYRYTGQTDIAIGTPVAGRNHPRVEGLIGFFLNMLVLRTDLSGNPTFRELLERIRKVCVDAFAHQDLPFEKLVEELRPKRDVTHNPLIQVTFALQNTPRCPVNLTGVTARDLDISAGVAKIFDLHLFMVEEVTGLRGCVMYNTNLFDADMIARFISHMRNLLEGIIANVDQRISDLPMLTEAERHRLLVEWNDTKRDYPKDKCIHELFETQVEKTPDAIALGFEDQQLTYSELNTRANQLARYLQKFGVGPDVLVGICVELSIEMVVGLLGILKAGGGYVPLDVNYPTERLEFMLADTQVSVLLTQSDLFEDGESRLDDSDGRSSSLDRRVQRICLDRDWELITRESDANPGNIPTADNLAYVIYTSGSTGQPKGVALDHRNTVGFLSWVHSTFTQEELSVVFAATSICFDLSVFEIFAPLTCGGMVILAQNALALARIPNRTKVSLLNTVPSAMNELLNLVAIPQSVRVINLAGEPLRTDLVRRIYESTSVRKVHDLYGPTECTTYSTWTCRTPDGPQTIGRPIANTQVYILDGSLNPVPVGVVGELHIGGDGLARGYLNRPELTAEEFIPDPFSTDSRSRLYKTGDLARCLPDGNIEFLGRIDHQVKIRGYRIELGEIEAVLAQHPGVREAIVSAREDKPADPSTGLGTGKQLAAYVVPKESAPATSELRAYLKAKLPDYMVPSAFVIRDCLPLTPNGKVDRKALASLAADDFESAPVYIAPRNATEEIIARIWAEILGRKRIGIHDNFFDLGGHSLKATQVVSRLRTAFRSEIPLRHMLEFPTIAELANAISGSEDQQTANPKDIDFLLTEIEAMSEEEAQKLLSQKTAARGRD